LAKIGSKIRTTNRLTIAASFALRYGSTSAMAVAPYLVSQCVPDVGLDNVSLRFGESGVLERAALHIPRCLMLVRPGALGPGDLVVTSEPDVLLARLRQVLLKQASGVVRALHEWSRFSLRGTWGLIASSWTAQFITMLRLLGRQHEAPDLLPRFFTGDDMLAKMQPTLAEITCHHVTRVYQTAGKLLSLLLAFNEVLHELPADRTKNEPAAISRCFGRFSDRMLVEHPLPLRVSGPFSARVA
jgi:hypothetical protein